jgi:parvulin-like peptidyl-prolyl isomerase
MQTRVGWIVFKVEDIRDAKLPPLAEVNRKSSVSCRKKPLPRQWMICAARRKSSNSTPQ